MVSTVFRDDPEIRLDFFRFEEDRWDLVSDELFVVPSVTMWCLTVPFAFAQGMGFPPAFDG